MESKDCVDRRDLVDDLGGDMPIEIKDIIAWGSLFVAVAGQFFHLKGRVALIEARQKDLREDLKDSLDRIDKKLDHIDKKLDNKADK